MRNFLQSLFAGWIGIIIGQIVWVEYFGQPFNLQLFNVMMIGTVASSFLIAAAIEDYTSRIATLKKIRKRGRICNGNFR